MKPFEMKRLISGSPKIGLGQLEMTPDQLIARKKQLVSAARALITGEVGLVHGSTRILRALDALGTEKPGAFGIFDEFYQAIPLDMPLGAARLEWSPELVIKQDVRLMKLEAKYRPLLLKAALELVKFYG